MLADYVANVSILHSQCWQTTWLMWPTTCKYVVGVPSQCWQTIWPMCADYLANVVGLPVQTTIRVIKNGSMAHF